LQINDGTKQVTLPDFLIVGAAKSGTTSLYYYLGQHPAIFLPKIKEPWFFSHAREDVKIIHPASGGRLEKYLILNLDQYVNLFKSAKPHQLCCEASTSYLFLYEKTIGNLKSTYGNASDGLKIIIILRNPIFRAWSHYQMHIRDGSEKLPFNQAITPSVIQARLQKNWGPTFDYIGYGKYYQQVNSYLRYFKNTKVILYDDLIENPKSTLNELLTFLGLSDEFEMKFDKKYNTSGLPKNEIAKHLVNFIYKDNKIKAVLKYLLPSGIRSRLKVRLGQRLFQKNTLPKEKKMLLAELFKDDIQLLSRLINKNLDHWLE